jgi:hypothetical protein
MFMVMDDVGSLIWRFGKKLIVSSGEAEQEQAEHRRQLAQPGPPAPPTIVSPAAE